MTDRRAVPFVDQTVPPVQPLLAFAPVFDFKSWWFDREEELDRGPEPDEEC